MGHARGVATRAIQAADKPELDWITAVREDDWSRRSCRLCCLGRIGAPHRRDHVHMTADEIIGEGGQSIILAIGPAILDCRILALDIAGFAQAPTESGYAGGECYSRPAVEETDHRRRWLLRACRERPRGGRAAEQRDES